MLRFFLATYILNLSVYAKVPKIDISSDKGDLVIYSNGEVEKGEDFNRSWNYDSAEDFSFEHFSKNIENKEETDKRDIYIERERGQVQSFLEFSKRSTLGLPSSIRLSSMTFKDGAPFGWVICRNEEQCRIVSKNFCAEILEIDQDREDAKVLYSEVLDRYSEELMRLKKDIFLYAKEKKPFIDKVLKVPYEKLFFDEFTLESNKALREKKYDPFKFSSRGAKYLNVCRTFSKMLPKEKQRKFLTTPNPSLPTKAK